jgi:hypothetical protein
MGQETSKPDTNEICFPSNVGKQILTDLNTLDKLKEEKKLTDNEIKTLEEKVVAQDSVISKLEQKDVNNKIIIESVKEKVTLVEEDNKNLRDENKKIKTKNTIIEIFSGALLTTVTLIGILK